MSGAESRRTLAELTREFGLQVRHGDVGDAELRGVSLDNRSVGPGQLFAALPGAHTHGARFAADAAARGAVAILTDDDGAASLAGSVPDVPVLIASEPRAILGNLAAWVHNRPADALTTFAVTGTNGKTTTSYMIEHILSALGATTGMIGTVELKVGTHREPAKLTTPEAPALHGLFAQMRDAGVSDAVMEVSSHALALHRVDGLRYDVAGFTNLTPDHLDLHGDMRNYFEAKASLFTAERSARGVVLIDDEWGTQLAERSGLPMVTVATNGTTADWMITRADASPSGTDLTLTGPGEQHLRVSLGLPGDFNVANAALAIVMVITAGYTCEQVHAALGGTLNPVVPGRMQVVATEPRVIVDFAHNTQALEQALAAARAGARGRVLLVFGATGDRDKTKRPHMGAVAVRGADVTIVTDDDPHNEDAAQIRREVLTGAAQALEDERAAGRPRELQEVAPRQAAIARAIELAAAADTVLIAGRGHETVQEIAGVDHHLDDRAEVRSAMARRGEAATPKDTP